MVDKFASRKFPIKTGIFFSIKCTHKNRLGEGLLMSRLQTSHI